MEVTDENGHRRVQFPLSWKDGCSVDVPQSLPITMRRLRLQSNKLAQQPEVAQKYAETFENMKRNGHIESMNEKKSSANKQNSIHYINHFSMGQKFRVVYYGALRINGISMSDVLYRGLIFMESLVGILISAICLWCHWRHQKYVFQVKIYSKYMFRFLPLKDHRVARNDDTWKFTVMPYDIISVPSIAGFCVKYTAARNYANVSASTAKSVEKDFCVDDLIVSVETVEVAKTLITEAIGLLATTGLVLF